MFQRRKGCGTEFLRKILACMLMAVLLVGMVPGGLMEVRAEESSVFTQECQVSNLNYSYTTLDGKTVTSAATNKPKLLVFYRTTCGLMQE